MGKAVELRTVGLLAAGFAFSALSQALVAGLLPLAAASIVGKGSLIFVPYGVLLIGMTLSSLIASLLIDRIGRREGLALGAALGVAGGLLLAISVMERQFTGLLLAAFWLGIAQGFGLYYRHLATSASRFLSAGPGAGIVLGAGVLAGIVGPGLAGVAESLFSPFLFVGSALLAASAHGLMIAAAALLPSTSYVLEGEDEELPEVLPANPVPATMIAAFAWFIMAAAMAATPLGLADCGIGIGGIVGAMSWHVIAMYAPALIAGPLCRRFGAMPIALSGLFFATAGGLIAAFSMTVAGYFIALGLIGSGWSFAVIGATTALANQKRQGRIALALHDGVLVLGALFGVIAVALLA